MRIAAVLAVLLASPAAHADEGAIVGAAFAADIREKLFPVFEVLMPDLRLEFDDSGDFGLAVAWPIGLILYDHDFGAELPPGTLHDPRFVDLWGFLEPQARDGTFYVGAGVRASAGKHFGGLIEAGGLAGGEHGGAAFVGAGLTSSPASAERVSLVFRRVFEVDASRYDLCFDMTYHY